MESYNPEVDTKDKSSDFIVCYIKNNTLSTQEQLLVANDFDFHNRAYMRYVSRVSLRLKSQSSK